MRREKAAAAATTQNGMGARGGAGRPRFIGPFLLLDDGQTSSEDRKDGGQKMFVSVPVPTLVLGEETIATSESFSVMCSQLNIKRNVGKAGATDPLTLGAFSTLAAARALNFCITNSPLQNNHGKNCILFISTYT